MKLLALVLTLLAALGSASAAAQPYPQRALRLIVALGALFGVFVPHGTPGVPLERLMRELPQISAQPDFRKRLVDIELAAMASVKEE